MKALLALVMSFCFSSAYAIGQDRGNGGDAIVCKSPTGAVTGVQLLDYYEAQTNGQILDIPNGATVQDILNQMFQRLERWSPVRAERYREAYRKFTTNTKFIDEELPDVRDSGVIVLPLGCDVKQMAYQTVVNDETFYFINQTLWNIADLKTQAGLIFHEITYNEFKAWDPTSSVPVRNFHRLIFSPEYLALKNHKEWFEKIRIAGVYATDICGGFYTPTTHTIEFDSFGNLVEAGFGQAKYAPKLPWPKMTIAGVVYEGEVYSRVGCYANGAVKSINVTEDYYVRGEEKDFYVGLQKFKAFNNGYFRFYPNGEIQGLNFDDLKFELFGSAIVASDVSFYPSQSIYKVSFREIKTFIVQKKKIRVSENVYLYESGQILKIKMAESAILKDCKNVDIKVSPMDDVTFANTGCVVRRN